MPPEHNSEFLGGRRGIKPDPLPCESLRDDRPT